MLICAYQTVRRAGIDATTVGAHSLRAGLVTSAAAAGVEERVIMDQTRHKNASTLRKYVRLGSLFPQNAAARVGL